MRITTSNQPALVLRRSGRALNLKEKTMAKRISMKGHGKALYPYKLHAGKNLYFNRSLNTNFLCDTFFTDRSHIVFGNGLSVKLSPKHKPTAQLEIYQAYGAEAIKHYGALELTPVTIAGVYTGMDQDPIAYIEYPKWQFYNPGYLDNIYKTHPKAETFVTPARNGSHTLIFKACDKIVGIVSPVGSESKSDLVIAEIQEMQNRISLKK